jgi:hypothetical protein
MKISKKNKDKQSKIPASTSISYFPYCCPENGIDAGSQSLFAKKTNKFIKVTLLK